MFTGNGSTRGGPYNRGTIGVSQTPMCKVVYKSGGIATVSQTVADDALRKGLLESMEPINANSNHQSGERR